MSNGEAGARILFEVSTPRAVALLCSLAEACNRKKVAWACFFTNDGVQCLDEPAVETIVATAAAAVACEFSWEHYMGGRDCPVESGSQTHNSRLLGDVERVISL